MIKLPQKLRDLLGTHGQLEAHAPNPPLFVTGCMRSGTTFLVDKLTCHPQMLKIGSELNEVWTKIGGAPCLKTCEYRGKEHADPQYAYNMTAHFMEFINESNTFKRKAMRMVTMHNSDVSRVNYDWKNIIPVNKSPHLMNKLDYVHELFPSSKVLLIIRDAYAQCSSLKKHFDVEHRRTGKRRFIPDDPKGCWSTWNSGGGEPDRPCYPTDISLLPEMWLRLNEMALEEVQKLPKDKYMIISYEKLIQEQEESLMSIFDFLDLLPEHKKEALNVSKKEIDLINTTTKGDPLNKWRQQLTPKEISEIDKVLEKNKDRYDRIMNAARGTN